MSIHGVLEDLALADVLQFVHLGRRTGTLFMWQDDERRAEIGFHDGRIVSAWTPGHRKLGDLLLDDGAVDRSILDDALGRQKAGGNKTLGQILLADGAIQREDIYRVIKGQIEATIFDLVTWDHGNFHFEVDELHPVDDIGLAPGELLDDLDLNTQMLLLEATRIFDERHRDPPHGDGLSPLEQGLRRAGLGRSMGGYGGNGHLPRSNHGGSGSGSNGHGGNGPSSNGHGANGNGHGQAGTTGPAQAGGNRGGGQQRRSGLEPVMRALRCQVVSDDQRLLTLLRQELPAERVRVIAVRLHEAGNRMPGESAAPLVILDLRQDLLGVDDVATLARTRPSVGVIAVVESITGAEEEVRALRRAGVISVVDGSDPTVVDACANLVRMLSQPKATGTFGHGHRGGFSRFRRVVFDVQSGLLSATMALNLMHVISESVERAVLLLVQGDELRAVGAFGFSQRREPLAEVTSGLHLRMKPGDPLHIAVHEAEPQNIAFDGADLPPELTRLLGRPASGQVVLFPVLGAERTISLIYTDNGSLPEEIEDLEILELATSQVGVAFENELLSQQMGGELGESSEDVHFG